MTRFASLTGVVLGLFIFGLVAGCGGDKGGEAKQSASQKRTSRKKRPAKKKLDMETYCRINTEIAKLGVEKYLPILKGKEYSEVKDEFARYMEEYDAIEAKHGFTGADMRGFAVGSTREINAYLREHPEYGWKKTPEQLEIKRISFEMGMAYAEDKMR